MSPTLYAINSLSQLLTEAHAIGDGQLTVEDGEAWGSPSQSLGICAAAFKPDDPDTPVFVCKLTGREGNVLIIGEITWGEDTVLTTEDTVACVVGAEYIDDLAEAIESKADTGHTHAIANVTGLQAALDGKASTSHIHDDRYYTESESDAFLSGKANTSHTHAIGDTTGLQAALDGKSSTSHTHDDRYYTESESDTLLSGKANTSHTHAISDVPGLQSVLDGKAATSHAHAAADITSGTIATARLGSGTADNTKFLRGDQTWATPSGTANNPSTYWQIGPNEFATQLSGAGLYQVASGTGAGFTQGTGDASHPGVVNLSTGTTATGVAYWTGAASGSAGATVVFGGGACTGIAIVKSPTTLSDGTDTYLIAAGFGDNSSASSHSPTDAALFRYIHSENSGRWVCVCRANGTETTADSGITVATSTWYNLRVEVNAAGTSVAFYINESLVATITTNIPTGTGRELGPYGGIHKSAGTNARTMNADLAWYYGTLTTAR